MPEFRDAHHRRPNARGLGFKGRARRLRTNGQNVNTAFRSSYRSVIFRSDASRFFDLLVLATAVHLAARERERERERAGVERPLIALGVNQTFHVFFFFQNIFLGSIVIRLAESYVSFLAAKQFQTPQRRTHLGVGLLADACNRRQLGA